MNDLLGRRTPSWLEDALAAYTGGQAVLRRPTQCDSGGPSLADSRPSHVKLLSLRTRHAELCRQANFKSRQHNKTRKRKCQWMVRSDVTWGALRVGESWWAGPARGGKVGPMTPGERGLEYHTEIGLIFFWRMRDLTSNFNFETQTPAPLAARHASGPRDGAP
jgi:hypothetical protein